MHYAGFSAIWATQSQLHNCSACEADDADGDDRSDEVNADGAGEAEDAHLLTRLV